MTSFSRHAFASISIDGCADGPDFQFQSNRVTGACSSASRRSDRGLYSVLSPGGDSHGLSRSMVGDSLWDLHPATTWLLNRSAS